MIKQYTKKPVTIEAVQWTGDNLEEVEKFTDLQASVVCGQLIIPTLEGTHIASEGDYIIKGIKGEFYPCKPDIFEQAYEETDWNLKTHACV